MEKTNCPNCGAVMTSDKCQYCGTIMYDFACIDTEKPFYIKIKRKGVIHRFKVLLYSGEMHISPVINETTYYMDDNPYILMNAQEYEHTIDLSFRILPEDGIIGLGIDTENVDPGAKPY